MAMVQVNVPDIGDFAEVEVIEIMVKVGDTVAVDQSVITVESDKASMEIPSSHAGVVKAIHVKVGDKTAEGKLMLEVEASAAAAITKPAAQVVAAPAPAAAKVPEVVAAPTAMLAAAAPAPSPMASVPVVPATFSGQQNLAHASPAVRAFARELGVDLLKVKGTADKGRITQDDVKGFIKAAMTSPAGNAGASASLGGGLNLLPWPKVDFAKFGDIKLEPLSRIKKISGQNLARNWVMIPHVTQFDAADITDLEQFRKDSNTALEKSGVKVTMLAFVMKACVSVLKKYPNFNASLDDNGDNLVLKQYYHLGFAADTPNGLVVPVLRDVDKKGVAQIAKETSELAAKAREGKLSPAEMQGASFTISSLGGIGGTAFTPIVNAPEVAILGLSKSDLQPKWDGAGFAPRLMLPLSLSYDHRVIDGAQAARFTAELASVLADMRKVLL